MNKNQSKD
jgi:hypothetical protein